MDILKNFKEKAASDLKTIVFAEGNDERIIRAAAEVETEKTAQIVILGQKEEIQSSAQTYGVDLTGVEIIDPQASEYIAEFRDEFYELRKHKGISKAEAEKAIKDPLYFGTMMVYTKKAHGMVAGAVNATANVLRPSFQIVKTKAGISTVSSALIMVLKDKSFGEDGVMVFLIVQ